MKAFILVLLACFVAAAPAFAQGGGSTDTYTYNFSLPSISDGVEGSPGEASFSITFTNGPFGAAGSLFDSYSWTGSPLGDGSSPSVAWTSASDLVTSPTTSENEIIIEYPSTSADVTSLIFIEPQSFWSTPGTNLSFNNGIADTANGLLYFDPLDFNIENFGDTNLGASFATTTGGVTTDPPCVGCTVTITATPAASVPEGPALPMLCLCALAVLGVMAFRNKELIAN